MFSFQNSNIMITATSVLAGLLIFTVSLYVLPVLFQCFYFKQQNLKIKYDADWALVTGGSSGIGRAIVEKLARQKINVVVVALDDQLLKDCMAELKSKYTDRVKFIAVGVNLSVDSTNEYMKRIVEATKELSISLVFNNAGYIKTGLFANMALDAQMDNIETNAISAVKLTHYFANQMIESKRRGFIAFTSSSAGLIPCPMSAIYGSTKAFISEFAVSIAPELYPLGIDVAVVHPSPVNSRFYTNAGKLSSLDFFKKTAVSPSTIADCLFIAAGKTVIYDQGYFTIGTRLILKLFDWNMLAELSKFTVQHMDDYKEIAKN